MVGDHQMDHAAEGAVAQQRKACVGAANVGQQGAHEALRRDRPLPALCKACRKASRHAVQSLAAIASYIERQRSWRALSGMAIGRGSGRARVGPYVALSVVRVSLKIKNKTETKQDTT